MGKPLAGLVDSVTVFRRGALVRRAFALPTGERTLTLGPLPRALDDGHVRVVRSEGASVRELRVALSVFEPDVSLPPAESEELERARLEVARAEARVLSLRETAKALAEPPLPARRRPKDAAPGPIPNDARLGLASFRGARGAALGAELLDADEALATARDRLGVVEERLRRASDARRTRVDELRKSVELVLAEPTVEGARLTLEYLVPGASWAPSYALRFDAAMKTARLERRASVAQRSGEDWTGVYLRLSTAEPARWTPLPDLPSLRIGRRQAAPARRGWRAPPSGADALFADYDAGFPSPSVRLQHTQTGAVMAEPAPPPPPSMPMSMPMPGGAPMPAPQVKMAAMAPMPAMAPPMPSRARASADVEAPKRKGGLLGGFGASDEGAFDLALELAEKEEAPAPAGVAIDVELLAYARLRLSAADAPDRGKLRPLDRVGVIGEALAGRELLGDLGSSVRGAEADASRLAPVPAGATLAAAVDGFDHAFDAAQRVDVPSDGQWHGVRLGDEELACDARYVVVPRESEDVFRFAELRLTSAPLLRGPADVYVADRYLLGRTLGPTATGGTLRLGLGVEPGIRVARNVRFEERSAGLMGRSLDLVHDVSIELRSSLASAASVEVRERIPTRREGDDDVEVREEEIAPSWEVWEPDANDAPQGSIEGGRRWRVKVAPGEVRTLVARWSVRIAAKNELVGGNRRES